MENKITKSAFKLASLLLFAAILGVTACTEDPEETLYRDDLIGPDYPAPVIESVNPPNEALAGITEITISGQNFSPNAGYNLVFFDSELGDVLSASENEIVVRAPAYADTAIDLKIAVRKVEDFSNVYNYKLNPAVAQYDYQNSLPRFFNIAVNGMGEIFASGADKTPNYNIFKLLLPDDFQVYASSGVQGGIADMRFGPGNQLFQLQSGASSSLLSYITDGGGNRERFVRITVPSSAFDFDGQGNIWVGSPDNIINYITYPDGEITEFPIDFSVSWVKVFEGYLYASGSVNDEKGIWRFQLNNGSLGEAEKYFDFSGNFPDTDISSFVMSADGLIYAALTSDTEDDQIVVITSSNSVEVLYPELILSPVSSPLVWGAGTKFYYTRRQLIDDAVVLSLVAVDLEKPGAVYYGRTL